ncbi:RagB/SusD family nutrient uptake outer membrane protein [Mucilaginibacter limnophilus]|uniref:RagB/SusD family nutrient uptake outer membrane protein n=1 Tax=Mucilaginibacter limnophilus TaxID=1932778 RepID=A0A3S2UPH5_9SPHI|nr:RagB/SusD family nutrient uptake outer membrane protein [Mucilaginibacter limnophilus]RVU01215.1 RagB/SusD family nutrient uptake outer membrane protein [Mucilaginibacter limnophilus]
MKKTLIYLLTGVVVTTACKKSFLSPTPQSTATAVNFYKNTADITNAVTAAYAPLQGAALYQTNITIMTELRSDNIEDQNPGADAGKQFNIDRFLAGADNTVFGDTWLALYNGISRCNNTLAHLDVVTDTRLRSQYEGELRFLRALHYFNLVRFWGNVPLVLQPVTTKEAQNIGRSSSEAVYAAIEEDLTKAAALLPATYAAADMGRASAGAAKGLLGKVYLTEKKYQQAVTTLKELLPQGTNPYKYTLLPNVADVFSVSNKLNAEILFAVHFEKSITGQGHSVSAYFNRPVLDPNLLNAYEASDTRRDLLNQQSIDANTAPVKKYFDTFDPTFRTVGNDYIVLRYADVLLMYVEALNEVAYSGDANSEQFIYLNAVRNRAKASAYTPAQLNSQQSFRAAVLQERRLELPLEFNRWFDLVRTNTAQQAMQNSGLTKLSIQAFQYLYPIPQGQIEVIHNPSIFPQNPGY